MGQQRLDEKAKAVAALIAPSGSPTCDFLEYGYAPPDLFLGSSTTKWRLYEADLWETAAFPRELPAAQAVFQ
jgi:hypothetical protein